MIIWFPQEQLTSCVAACIRMALTGFRQNLSEKQIRRILGSSTIGYTLFQAHQQMRLLGVDATLHDDWSLVDLRDCLRDGWNPIIGIDRQFLGHQTSSHAVVVVAVSSHAIQFFDPLGSSMPENVSLETFENAWGGAAKQALVIKSPFPQIGEIKP
jgi:ABC-type bacteriocin/lantibiotic exporter with double-glycine peptidase domain